MSSIAAHGVCAYKSPKIQKIQKYFLDGVKIVHGLNGPKCFKYDK